MRFIFKRGLIKEYADKEGKRAKRIELTDKGKKAIKLSNDRIRKNANMLMRGLEEEDQELCIQLLKGIEIELSDYWSRLKFLTFSIGPKAKTPQEYFSLTKKKLSVINNRVISKL